MRIMAFISPSITRESRISSGVSAPTPRRFATLAIYASVLFSDEGAWRLMMRRIVSLPFFAYTCSRSASAFNPCSAERNCANRPSEPSAPCECASGACTRPIGFIRRFRRRLSRRRARLRRLRRRLSRRRARLRRLRRRLSRRRARRDARRLELRERFSHLADGAQHAKSPFARKVDEYDVSAQFSAPGALQGRSGVWVSTQLTVDTLRHG